MNNFCTLAARGSSRAVLRTLRAHRAEVPVPVLDNGLRMLRDRDERKALAGLHCAVEFILGDADPLVPVTVTRSLRKLLPRAGIHVFPDCGHVPFLSHPQQTLEILRQLSA